MDKHRWGRRKLGTDRKAETEMGNEKDRAVIIIAEFAFRMQTDQGHGAWGRYQVPHNHTRIHKLIHAPTQSGTQYTLEPNREVFFTAKDILYNSEGVLLAIEFDQMFRNLATCSFQDIFKAHFSAFMRMSMCVCFCLNFASFTSSPSAEPDHIYIKKRWRFK